MSVSDWSHEAVGVLRALHDKSALLLSVLIAGCSPSAPEWLEWTAPPGVRATVAIVHGPSGEPVGMASSADQRPLFVLADPSAVRLELLHYASDLSELGLESGPLEDAAPCQRSCALADPTLREAYTLESGRLDPITSPEVLGDSVLDLLIPDRGTQCGAQCLDLESVVLPLEYQRFVRVTAPLPDGRIVVIQDDGSSRVVSPAGEMVPGCDVPMPAEARAYPAGSWTDPGGTLWLSLENGTLLQLPLADLAAPGPCAVETATVGPGGRTLYHFAGRPNAEAPLEVVALAGDRSFWRFAENHWQMLGRLTGEGPGLHKPADLRRTGGVFWLGPGRAAAFQWEQEILYAEGDSAELVPVIVGSGAGSWLIAGARSAEHGFLLSMRDLGILQANDLRGPWTRLLGYTANRLASIVPFRGQLLLASVRQLEVFHDELGLCDRVDLINSDYVRQVTPFPNTNVVLVGDYSESEPNEPFQRSIALVGANLACDQDAPGRRR